MEIKRIHVNKRRTSINHYADTMLCQKCFYISKTDEDYKNHKNSTCKKRYLCSSCKKISDDKNV